MERAIVYSLFIVTFLHSCGGNSNTNIAYNIPDPGRRSRGCRRCRSVRNPCRLDCTGIFNLCTDADKERLGRQAIKAIHEQMDDDKDGLIEASESRDVRFQSPLSMRS